VFLANALDSAHLCFFMAAQEVEEPFPLDGAQLGGGQRLSGNLVEPVGENRVQAQHGAWTSDEDDHLLVIRAAGGQLKVPAANEIEAAGIFSLGEERGLGR